MIIDADTHISPTGEDAMAITYDELLRRMDRAGVDKALTWLRPPYMREIGESNGYLYRATQQHHPHPPPGARTGVRTSTLLGNGRWATRSRSGRATAERSPRTASNRWRSESFPSEPTSGPGTFARCWL